MLALINPGAGPVTRATTGARCVSVRSAIASMRAFARATGCALWTRARRLDGDGRFGFVVSTGARRVSVLMPGIPHSKLASESGFPPRLYVDGNSWTWRYAIDVVRERMR